MSRAGCPHCGFLGQIPQNSHCPACGAVVSRASSANQVAPSPLGQSSGRAGQGSYAVGGTARLVLGDGTEYVLDKTTDNTIGSAGCRIIVKDVSVPAHAATIVAMGNDFVLQHVGQAMVSVNSRTILFDTPLKDGDKIVIGSLQLRFSFSHAVPSSAITPPPTSRRASIPVKAQQPVPRGPTKGQPTNSIPQTPALNQFPPPSAVSPPPAITISGRQPFTLKAWPDAPEVEGFVTEENDPQSWEDAQGQLLRMVSAAVLSAIIKSLSWLPLMMHANLFVSTYRVLDQSTRRQVNVLHIDKKPRRDIKKGDFVAVWGSVEAGNVLLKKAYIYDTDAWTKGRGK